MQERYYSEVPVLSIERINEFCRSEAEKNRDYVRRWNTVLCVVIDVCRVIL